MGIPNSQITVTPYQPAYSGNNAVAVGVINNLPVNSSSGGFLTAKFAFTNHPTSISGYFFLPNGGYAVPPLNLWISLKGNSVIIGQGGSTFFLWPSSYTFFDLPINYSSQNAIDSAFISIQANWYLTIGPYNGPVFTLDDLSLNYSTGVSEFQNQNIKIYFDNSTNLVNLNKENLFVKLFDLSGRKLFQETIADKQFSISNFSKGIYILKIEDEKKLQTFRIIKY
jgi:hypothetical protein